MEKTLGPYTLLSELGTGGMGTVYLAEAPGGERVALKLIHPHLLASPSFYQRFLREAEIGKRVHHANVVRTLDVQIAAEKGDAAHYLVMEYVEGQTLRALLEELGQVPEELCRHIGREVAKALQAIHTAGAVHRDLKPENVLITSDHVVKVMDLGVARLVDEAIRLSQTGAFAGSVLYAAPEQFRGGEPDPRTDLYSLGLVLYELVTGRHPSGGDDFAEIMQRRLTGELRPATVLNPQISPFFEEFLNTLLARTVELRFGDAGEVVEVLEQGEQSAWWQERAQLLRKGQKRPLRRLVIPRETRVHGRDEPMETLETLFARVRDGRGQVMLVEGEAGIGKTRLVDEFVGRLQERGEEAQFLFGSYPPGGGASPVRAFADAYRDHFGREGLELTLRHYLRQTPILIPAFAALLRGEPAPAGVVPLDRDSIQTVFVHATRALARERPTLILIDDLQFAPEEGRALFSALAQVAAEHSYLLVGAARPGLPEEWSQGIERLPHAARAVLARLGPKDLARVLIDAFESERLAQELGLQIAQKSDGNPFFVFEIIRGLREGGYIHKEDDGSWARSRVIEQISIPSSVLDLIQARIAELEEQDKDLVDVASCCGFEFDPLLVAEALGVEQIPAMKRFARIEKKHRLIRSSGRTCVFDHHQIQEALYSGMPELLREPYHAALGEALETRTGAAQQAPQEVSGPLAVELANHFFKGARPARAKRYLYGALDHLQANFQNDAVVEMADRALGGDGLLEPSEQVDVRLRKAERLELLGRLEEEQATLEEALGIADATREPALCARVQHQLGGHFLHTGDYTLAQEHLDEALRLARAAGDARLEAAAEGVLGTVWRHLGEYSRSHEHHERDLELARGIGDDEEVAKAALNLSAVFTELGQTGRARQYLDTVLRLTEQTGNLRWQALARGSLGMLDFQAGDFKEARRHFDKSLMFSHEIGARRAVTEAIGQLGWTFLALGHLQDALLHFDRHLVLSRETGSRLGEAAALQGQGALYIVLGDPGKAKDALERSLQTSREIGVRRVEGFALQGLAQLAELVGRPTAADRRYGDALAVLREIGNRRDEAELLLDMGRVRFTIGAHDAARRIFEEAERIATDLSFHRGMVMSAVHLALLDGEDVGRALRVVEEHGERTGAMDRMRAWFLLWKASGQLPHLKESYRLLAELRRFAPRDYKNTMIAKVPWHREIVVAGRENGL